MAISFSLLSEIEKMTLPESRPPPTVNPKRPPSSDDSVLNFPSLSSHYSRPYEENSGTSPPEAIETAEVYSEHGTDGVTRTVFKHPKKKEQVHHQQGKGGVVHYGEEQYQQKCGMTCQGRKFLLMTLVGTQKRAGTLVNISLSARETLTKISFLN